MGNLLSFFVCIAERSASPAGAPVGTYPGAGDRRLQARRPRYGAERSPSVPFTVAQQTARPPPEYNTSFLLASQAARRASERMPGQALNGSGADIPETPALAVVARQPRALAAPSSRRDPLPLAPTLSSPAGEAPGVRATLRYASLGPRLTPPSAPSTNTDLTSASVMSGLRSASTGSESVRTVACLVPPTDAFGADVLPPDDPPQRAASSASGAGPIAITPDVSLCSRYVVAEPGVRVRWRRIVVV